MLIRPDAGFPQPGGRDGCSRLPLPPCVNGRALVRKVDVLPETSLHSAMDESQRAWVLTGTDIVGLRHFPQLCGRPEKAVQGDSERARQGRIAIFEVVDGENNISYTVNENFTQSIV